MVFRSSHANIGREHVHVQEVGVVGRVLVLGCEKTLFHEVWRRSRSGGEVEKKEK